MSTNIFRGPLTDVLLEYLHVQLNSYGDGIPVGDGVVPVGAGWRGEPNAPGSHFQPYVVITAGTANYSSGPIGGSQEDWRFPYNLGSYNVNRVGLDWMADRVRGVMAGLRGQTMELGEENYTVQYVRTESIGGTNRVDATDPPFWGQVDSVSLWMTRS